MHPLKAVADAPPDELLLDELLDELLLDEPLLPQAAASSAKTLSAAAARKVFLTVTSFLGGLRHPHGPEARLSAQPTRTPRSQTPHSGMTAG
jgi:hypothetical protein